MYYPVPRLITHVELGVHLLHQSLSAKVLKADKQILDAKKSSPIKRNNSVEY